MSGPLDILDVLVIGAGQAGLALGQQLNGTGARFMIVDAAAEIGETWAKAMGFFAAVHPGPVRQPPRGCPSRPPMTRIRWGATWWTT